MQDLRAGNKTKTIRANRRDWFELGFLEFVNASDASDKQIVDVHTITFTHANQLEPEYFQNLKKYYNWLEGTDTVTIIEFYPVKND